MSLELNLIIEGFHDFEKAKRLGSLSEEYLKEASTLYLSKEDASALGVSEGDVVEVLSKAGSLKARVKVSDEVKKGLAFMPPSPCSMALISSSEYPLIIRVKVSKSTGEPTSLATLLPS
ncbi:MAG: molybdopterin dinucleotide binding domain-containing protein [Candidatus Nezhaarchaeales archaeon]